MSSRDPFDELNRLVDRMNERFGDLDVPRPGGGFVPVDVEARPDEFVVTAELPGYDPDSIDVELDDRTLRITADAESEASDEGETTGEEGVDVRYVRRERRHDRVSRTVRIPDAVEEDGTTASYDRGVLTVRLPRPSDGEGGVAIPVE